MYLNDRNIFNISLLIIKKIKNQITDQEEILLNEWINKSVQNKRLFESCLQVNNQEEAYEILNRFDSNEAWQSISNKIIHSPSPFLKPTTYISAALLLIISGILIAIFQFKNNNIEVQVVNKTEKFPAVNKARIRLSDGTVLNLNDSENSVITNHESIKYPDGEDIVNLKNIKSAIIETPRGGYYNVVLPDGTKVQLNAASSITYPITFDKNKREVAVTGEVYFDVVHQNKKPFIVKSHNQNITVLGTKFNVKTYTDQKITKTTLIEGKVQVDDRDHKTIILTPGFQSILRDNGFYSQKVDVQSEIAWIYGKFNFDNKNLREVMSEISNWYDIDIEINKDVPDIEFFGGTFRNNKLSTILSLLENNDLGYEFKNNKTLTITNQTN